MKKSVSAEDSSLKGHTWGIVKWKCPCGYSNTSMGDRHDSEREYECSSCNEIITVTDIFL